jgi:hypothetical protein
MHLPTIAITAIFTALCSTSCTIVPLAETPAATAPSQPVTITSAVSFNSHVRPILESRCIGCHNGTRLRSGFLNLASRADAFSDGPWGPRIVPGNPDKSLIVSKLDISHSPVRATPRIEDRITAHETAVLRKWIASGADWPEGEPGQLRKR